MQFVAFKDSVEGTVRPLIDTATRGVRGRDNNRMESVRSNAAGAEDNVRT